MKVGNLLNEFRSEKIAALLYMETHEKNAKRSP